MTRPGYDDDDTAFWVIVAFWVGLGVWKMVDIVTWVFEGVVG